HEVDRYALLAWLRLGELEAQKIRCGHYDAGRFRDVLHAIRERCAESPAEVADFLCKACAESGVTVVFAPEIKGARAWGVTHWVTSEKAILQMSLRGKTDD